MQSPFIFIPKHVPAVGPSPVSADSLSRFVCVLANTRLLVFVVVAFPPPPLTTQANEAQLSSSDCATSEADQASKRHPFLSGRSGNLSTSLASLSASAWGVNSNFKSACCCSQTARHRTARLSPRRSRSLEKRDGMRVIHVA